MGKSNEEINVRPDKIQYFSALSLIIASRASCIRRKIGCVLVDKNYFLLSTGYNGPPPNNPHCIEIGKCRREDVESGSKLELCAAIHAEQNALLQCRNTMDIEYCFITHSPCIHCLKLLMNTGCKEIYYIESYPNVKEAIASSIRWQDSGENRHMTIVGGISVDFKWLGMPNVK